MIIKFLKSCPACGKIPKLAYCCGDYLVSGEDPNCPCCGTAFTEMHSSEDREIEAWNRWTENFYIKSHGLRNFLNQTGLVVRICNGAITFCDGDCAHCDEEDD